MRKQHIVSCRVDDETKAMLDQLAKTDGSGMSKVLRAYAEEQVVRQQQAEIDAEATIRAEIGPEAMGMVKGLRVRPSQYLRAWQQSYPPERTPEEQRALEDDQARRMGLSPEQYQDGKRRGPRGHHDDPET